MPAFPQVKWYDASSIKKELLMIPKDGLCYFSQYGIYEPRKSGSLKSSLQSKLGIRPYIYGVDFFYASGSWFTVISIAKAKKNLINIVQTSWREYRAIPCFSWHLENPYVPSGYDNRMGCRYRFSKQIPTYPKEHQYVIKEILEGTGEMCGKGNLSGKDNVTVYRNPRAWFEARCKEVAEIINQLTDDNGKPIPFIFRLWHECEDSWMWWGKSSVSVEDYKKFFILTEKLIRKDAPKAEILWGYCPDRFWNSDTEFMMRYPGDKFVDIIGFDDYSIGKSEDALRKTIKRAQVVSAVAKRKNKVAALFETGNTRMEISGFCMGYLNKVLMAEGVGLSLVQLWSTAKFITDDQIEDRRTFVNAPNIIVYRNMKSEKRQ